MAMKQTQTKMFDFADVGLDFCSGSKNLFPDRFKKMLSQGYNEQTVASVSVTGNQVTLNYGVAHGYAADRVLKVNSGALAGINDGEFWIDAVTTTSVTMTIDAAPASIAGGFVTKIASLGFELVYEQPPIHIYKFKSLNDEELFLRLCFQTVLNHKNTVVPCVGWTADLASGVILDPLTLEANRSVLTPGSEFNWNFTNTPSNVHNNHTYSQGFSTFGRGVVVGSKCHLIFMSAVGVMSCFTGILPACFIDISGFRGRSPVVMFGVSNGAPGTNYTDYTGKIHKAFVGDQAVTFSGNKNSPYTFDYGIGTTANFYPENIEAFNTVPTEPLLIYEAVNKKFIGAAYGAHLLKLGTTTQVIGGAIGDQPVKTTEIDFDSQCLVHSLPIGGGLTNIAYLAIPVEGVKIEN